MTRFRCMTSIAVLLLALSLVQAGDTVTVTPQAPTDKDSLHFSLFNLNLCCVTGYSALSVSVHDSVILLSYQYDDSLCASVNCFAAGSRVGFSCAPQNVGRYSIYKAESRYCQPGGICPASPIIMKKVGGVVITAASYPYYTRSPVSPVQGDTVRIRKVIGIEPNPCCLHQYKSSDTLLPTPIQHVPTTIVKLSYENIPVACPAVVCASHAVIENGPLFTIQNIRWGDYLFVDGIDTVMRFSVAQTSLRDTLTVTPAKLTDRDSVVFNLFDADVCCCASYSNITVAVIDSSIILSSVMDSSYCGVCACLSIGHWVQFRSGPLKAGHYSMYESRSNYCPPGQVCVLSLKYVLRGPLRVYSSTGTDVSSPGMAPATGIVSATLSRGAITIISSQDFTDAALSVFAINGRRVLTIPALALKRGSNRVILNDAVAADELLVIRISRGKIVLLQQTVQREQ